MCVEFVVCDRKSISIIEYYVVNDECELSCKQSFKFGDDYNEYCNGICGIYVSNENDDIFMYNEVKSNDDNSNDMNLEEKCNIILFGSYGYGGKFISSLQWLSLKIQNNENDDNGRSYNISIDYEKTKQFQNTFVDKTFANRRYNSFGYTKWKHYLILFGGQVDYEPIDSIFYFDFDDMKWHKSAKVL